MNHETPPRPLTHWHWPEQSQTDVQTLLDDWHRLATHLHLPSASTYVWQCGRGEPVLCLHGVPTSAYVYRWLLPALAQQGVHAMAIDWPGMGLADRPEHFDYSWCGLARWLSDALHALGLRRVHLVTHSIAGPIALECMRLMPEQVASLSVVSSMMATATYRRPWYMSALSWPLLGPLYLKRLRGSWFESLYRHYGICRDLPPGEIMSHLALLLRQDEGAAFLRIMRGFVKTRDFEQSIRQAILKHPLPTQLIWGDRDQAIDFHRHAPDTCSVLGCGKTLRLSGGHFLSEDSPDELAQSIAGFVHAHAIELETRHHMRSSGIW